MAYKIKRSKVVSRWLIQADEYAVNNSAGTGLLWFWFEIPGGMSYEEAFATQEHHGPFKTEKEMRESQRILLLLPRPS